MVYELLKVNGYCLLEWLLTDFALFIWGSQFPYLFGALCRVHGSGVIGGNASVNREARDS